MNIQLKMYISVILEAVKAETHIKGQVDRAMDEKASKVAYQEEAGDDSFHERKLMRGIYTSLDALKGELSQYILSSGASTADNVIENIDEANDEITLNLEVSESFNKGYTNSLARLCSKYIEDSTLVLWWGTFNANQAQYYTSLLASDSIAISKCFVKVAPRKVEIPYTQHITVEGDVINVSVGELFNISYTLDDCAKDDIEFFSPSHCVHWNRGLEQSFDVKVKNEGLFRCKLYSLHDETVEKALTIIAVKD